MRWQEVKQKLLARVHETNPGESLPSYDVLANELNCSVTPIKTAMRQLAREGIVSLHRGRLARVPWNKSFSRSAMRLGGKVETRPFSTGFRLAEAAEEPIWKDLGLESHERAIVCKRVRIVDNVPLALQACYINPAAFESPELFFIRHDVSTESLSAIYQDLGLHLVSVRANLCAALADEQERLLLSLEPSAPVLRSLQWTVVEHHGEHTVLEVMHASYTQDVNFSVDRTPTWRNSEELYPVGAKLRDGSGSKGNPS